MMDRAVLPGHPELDERVMVQPGRDGRVSFTYGRADPLERAGVDRPSTGDACPYPRGRRDGDRDGASSNTSTWRLGATAGAHDGSTRVEVTGPLFQGHPDRPDRAGPGTGIALSRGLQLHKTPILQIAGTGSNRRGTLTSTTPIEPRTARRKRALIDQQEILRHLDLSIMGRNVRLTVLCGFRVRPRGRAR